MRLADRAATAATRRAWAIAAFAVPAVLMGVLAVTRALRLQPSRDELATRAFASVPFDELWAAVSHVDFVVSPFYAIAHVAYAVMPSDLGLRVPSMLGAIAAVIATTCLARGWWGTTTGFVAGLVVAVNPLAVEMATTARPYALATFFVVLAALAADRAAASPRLHIAGWVGYAACVVTAGLMHLFSLLAIAPILALVAVRGWRALSACVAASSAAALVLLPFVIAARTQQEQVAWIAEPNPAVTFGILANLVASPARLGIDAVDAVAIVIIVGLSVAAAVIIVGAVRRSPGRTGEMNELARFGYALAATLLPWGVLAVVSIVVEPVLRTAYITPSVAGLALLVAASLHAVLSRERPVSSGRHRVAARAAAVAVAGYVVFVGATTAIDARTWRQDDFAGLARAVEASVDQGDLIVVVQRYHETGLAAGLARFTDDLGFTAEVSARLPVGSQPLVEARRVTSTAPLRTDVLPSGRGGATKWLVSTGIPLGAPEMNELARLGLECVADSTRDDVERFGGLRLSATRCNGD